MFHLPIREVPPRTCLTRAVLFGSQQVPTADYNHLYHRATLDGPGHWLGAQQSSAMDTCLAWTRPGPQPQNHKEETKGYMTSAPSGLHTEHVLPASECRERAGAGKQGQNPSQGGTDRRPGYSQDKSAMCIESSVQRAGVSPKGREDGSKPSMFPGVPLSRRNMRLNRHQRTKD